jgi:hypothetical protein
MYLCIIHIYMYMFIKMNQHICKYVLKKVMYLHLYIFIYSYKNIYNTYDEVSMHLHYYRVLTIVVNYVIQGI